MNKKPILPLLVISAAFLLIIHHERSLDILENKWKPGFDIRSSKEFFLRQPSIANPDLSRYNIKIDFTATLYDINFDFTAGPQRKFRGFEIRFCDRYSLVFDELQKPPDIYYYETNSIIKKYPLRADNWENIVREKGLSKRAEYKLYLECDLKKKTANIYINNKFVEKITFNQDPGKYSLILDADLNDIYLNKAEIYDEKGKVLFSANYRILFFYKCIAYILLIFGLFILFLQLCFGEKKSSKRFFYFVLILLFAEGFLRIGERANPNFNIRLLAPEWQFAKFTNIYGSYDSPQTIRIGPDVYRVPKQKDTKRIICLGASIVDGWRLPDPSKQSFCALLKAKLNNSGYTSYEVLKAVLPVAGLNGAKLNVYFKEVLLKLEPDLVIFYTRWLPTTQKKQPIEDFILYQKAKKIVRSNREWVNNDRLLYAALEFKKPIKEIVLLYNFCRNSYLFMGLDTLRKRLFNKLFYFENKPPAGMQNRFDFEETLMLCRDKKIKVLLILPFDSFYFQNYQETKTEILRLARENPEIYYLDLEKTFIAHKDFAFSYDRDHLRELGYMLITDKIYEKLAEIDFLNK